MRLVKSYCLLILIFLQLIGGERFKWSEIDFLPNITNFRILDVEQENTIWLYDAEFNLYKKTSKSWQKINSPYDENVDPITILKIDENKFFAWAFDKNYNSHIRIFENDKWTNLKFTVELPLSGVLKNGENDYYIHGNFGTLIRLQNDVFTPIKNPFKNHIWSAIKSQDGTIWFGSKYDGIFKYKDEIFTKVDFADNSNYEIKTLIEKNNTIFAYHDEHNIFELSNNKFVKIKRSLNEISGNIYDPKIGLTTFSFLKESQRVKLSYPSKLKPSQTFVCNDSLVYLITDNKLLRGTKYDKFYFYELAGSYLIDGAEQNSSRQAFFNDFNNDGFNDLLVINSYPQELNSLYAANYSYPFQERFFKLESKLPNLSNRVHHFADLNKDYFDDVIISINDSNGTGISIYWNNKNFSFIKNIDLYSPEYLSKSPIRNIQTVDFDNDGDLDINLSYYYGKEDNPGNDIIYYNNFNGNVFEIDTSFSELTRGWNQKSTFVDIDNDNDLDWYISSLWWEDRILQNNNGIYSNVTSTHLKDSLFLNTYGTAFADIDNDGDMDLIRTCDEQLVAISLNDGNGIFTDYTDSLINKNVPLRIFTYRSLKSINVFDVNNDGYSDILLTNNFVKGNLTLLLINNNGKGFYKYDNFGVNENESFYASAVTDIDYDGDLDIYLIRDGKNLLMVNNLDNQNYLRIKLVGIGSNTSAKNSKIWIYKNGGLNNKDSLLIFRETGIDNFSSIHKNENTIHFGLKAEYFYDVKVQFQSGKEITLVKVKPPQILTITEDKGLIKHSILLSNTLFNLVMTRNIQLYAVVIFITVLIIGFSIKYGHEKYHKDIRLSLALVIVNFSFFWIILLLANDSSSQFLKFVLPSIVASLGVILPNVIFFSIKNNILNRDISEYKDELLDHVINFSHGEWALKNINSLIFLLQSIPTDITANEKYKAQLRDRVNTYDTLTRKSIEKIISISKQIEFENEITKQLMHTTEEIKTLNKKIISNNFYFTEKEKKLFKILKEIIKLIRNNIISEYSCNSIEVIDRLLETNKSFLKENNVNVDFIFPSDLNKSALIKSNDLADIIDNSISNAVKSFKEPQNRTIVIEVKWVAPKIKINIMNNGEMIPKESWENIFEKGISIQGSSGLGLFNSRNTLEKYGGRIILVNSTNKWTSFLIELNEGFINEAAYSDN